MDNPALATLLSLVPAPETPYVGERDWEAVFTEVGTRLPNEYVELMNHYGAGMWAGWLRFSPPGRPGIFGMPEKSAQARDGYRTLREDWPEEFPLSVWPEPGGFLPVADTAHGDYLGWLAEGDDPESWPLIFWPRHNDQGPPLTCGLAEVVHALLIGDYEKFGFPSDDEEDEEDLGSHPADFEAFAAARYDRHG